MFQRYLLCAWVVALGWVWGAQAVGPSLWGDQDPINFTVKRFEDYCESLEDFRNQIPVLDEVLQLDNKEKMLKITLYNIEKAQEVMTLLGQVQSRHKTTEEVLEHVLFQRLDTLLGRHRNIETYKARKAEAVKADPTLRFLMPTTYSNVVQNPVEELLANLSTDLYQTRTLAACALFSKVETPSTLSSKVKQLIACSPALWPLFKGEEQDLGHPDMCIWDREGSVVKQDAWLFEYYIHPWIFSDPIPPFVYPRLMKLSAYDFQTRALAQTPNTPICVDLMYYPPEGLTWAKPAVFKKEPAFELNPQFATYYGELHEVDELKMGPESTKKEILKRTHQDKDVLYTQRWLKPCDLERLPDLVYPDFLKAAEVEGKKPAKASGKKGKPASKKNGKGGRKKPQPRRKTQASLMDENEDSASEPETVEVTPEQEVLPQVDEEVKEPVAPAVARVPEPVTSGEESEEEVAVEPVSRSFQHVPEEASAPQPSLRLKGTSKTTHRLIFTRGQWHNVTYDAFQKLWRHLGGTTVDTSGSHRALKNRAGQTIGGTWAIHGGVQYGPKTIFQLRDALTKIGWGEDKVQ